MHMSDALLSAPVAIVADTLAVALLAVAAGKVKKNVKENLVPLMGVMGAFIFAAQMVNFAIPGTGSSGHIVGGVLLAALLGPWAGFITLTSVLIIQCLIFADGGLMALGCNIINMGAMTTLVAYPLIFRPLMRGNDTGWKIMVVSVLTCVIGLELGACLVSLETSLSGITALPYGNFLALMCGIHLPIGFVEGLATGVVLVFISKYRPDLFGGESTSKEEKKGSKKIVVLFAAAALIIAGGLAFLASEAPDGLEWSIQKITGSTDIEAEHVSTLSESAEHVQEATSIMPDYDNTFAGVAGAVMVVVLVWGVSAILVKRKRPATRTADDD